ncbi:MAG: hypothetical protein WA902_14640, partial [Thermosynechococcaceae cyanobacterium]
MRVGTLPWLLRHEWRLWCRDPQGRDMFVNLFTALLIILAIPLSICIGWIVLANFNDYAYSSLQAFRDNYARDPDQAFWTAVNSLGFYLFYLLLCVLPGFSRVLTRPAAFDLPASSPLNPQVFFRAQFCKFIFQSLSIYCVALPISCCAAVLMRSVQPLIGMAIVGLQLTVIFASLSTCSGLVLIRWLGVRGTRRLFFLIPIFFALVCFVGPLLLIAWDAQQFQQLWQDYIVNNALWRRESWLWLPVRALLLEPQAILLMTVLTGSVAWLTYTFFPAIFVAALQQSQHQSKKPAASKNRPKPFVSGVTRSIVIKEWR